MARTQTLFQLQTSIQDRIDFGLTGTGYETTANLTQIINGSLSEVWGLLTLHFGENYYFTTVSLTLTPNVASYSLPADFFKLLGVDVALDSTGLNWTQITPFQLQNRNMYSYANSIVQPANAYTNLKYNVQGSNLVFIPQNQVGSQVLRYFYCPCAPVLVNPADTFDGVNGWEELVILDACIKLAAKAEYDASVYMQQKEAMLMRMQTEAAQRQAGDPMAMIGGWNSLDGSGLNGGPLGWGP